MLNPRLLIRCQHLILFTAMTNIHRLCLFDLYEILRLFKNVKSKKHVICVLDVFQWINKDVDQLSTLWLSLHLEFQLISNKWPNSPPSTTQVLFPAGPPPSSSALFSSAVRKEWEDEKKMHTCKYIYFF